jgi:hypothetical protein
MLSSVSGRPLAHAKRAAGIVLLLLATACADTQWARAGADVAQVERDLHECRARAWREAELPAPRREVPPVIQVSPGPGGVPSVAVLQPQADPFESWPAEQRRYADACMREKGYGLIPAR